MKYNFFSFDTEGAGKLRYNRGPKKGEEGRSVLVLGNADGEAIIFYDPNDVTDRLRRVFADPTILKVQTGVDADIVLLPFQVFGLVNLGCFVPFLALPRQFHPKLLALSLARICLSERTKTHRMAFPNGHELTAMREYKNETFHLIKDRNFRSK